MVAMRPVYPSGHGPGFASSTPAKKSSGSAGSSLSSSLKKIVSSTNKLAKVATSNAQQQDGLSSLYDWANQFGTWSGGSGGSGGSAGYDPTADIAKATGRYNTQRGDLDSLYTQYADSLRPNQANTKAAYDSAIQQANNAGGQIASTVTNNMNDQTAKSNAALGSLGVTGAAATPTATQDATNKNLSSLAQNNGTWANMENVLSNAQQNRDALDVQGATDAGVEAKKQLMDAYNTYVQQLQAQAGAGASSGSGGSAPSYSNPMLDMLNKSVLQNGINSYFGTGSYAKKTSTKTIPSQSQYKKLQNSIAGLGPSPSNAQLVKSLPYSVYATYQNLGNLKG